MSDKERDTPRGELTEEFRDSLTRTADWLENLLTEQRAGPGKNYTQPRSIQVDVWDNCDSGGESVDGFTFDDGEVEYIVALIRASIAAPSEREPKRVGLPLLYNIVCLHRQPKDENWQQDFNELMRLADKLLYEQGYEVSPYTLNEHQVARDSALSAVEPHKLLREIPSPEMIRAAEACPWEHAASAKEAFICMLWSAMYSAAQSAVAPLVTKEPISTSSMRHLPSAAPQVLGNEDGRPVKPHRSGGGHWVEPFDLPLPQEPTQHTASPVSDSPTPAAAAVAAHDDKHGTPRTDALAKDAALLTFNGKDGDADALWNLIHEYQDSHGQLERELARSKAGECLKCGMGPLRESCAYPESCEHPGGELALKLNQTLLSATREPDGWQLVPYQATPEMIQAAQDRQIEAADYIAETSIEFALWRAVWLNMLRVAPRYVGERK